MKITRVIAYFFMVLGFLLFTIGAFCKIQHWPDMFAGMISGPIAELIGVILFIVSLNNRKKNDLP